MTCPKACEFFPPATRGLLDFIRALILLLLSPSSFSSAISRSQWALPGLHCKFSIAVGTAVPVLDCSGHFRTSPASSRAQGALPDPNSQFSIAVGTAGARQLGALDLSGKLPVLDCSGHCWTSTASSRARWALPDLKCQEECQHIFQKECQNICQIECPNICQIE